MQVAKLNKKRKKKKTRMHGRREDNDPLRSFDGATGVDAANKDEPDQDDGMAGFFDDDDDDDDDNNGNAVKKQKTQGDEPKLFMSTRDGTGKSSAGRNQWKERHKKGKFSNKKRKSERKGREPMGI